MSVYVGMQVQKKKNKLVRAKHGADEYRVLAATPQEWVMKGILYKRAEAQKEKYAQLTTREEVMKNSFFFSTFTANCSNWRWKGSAQKQQQGKMGERGEEEEKKSKAGKKNKGVKEFSQKTELYIKEQKRALRRMWTNLRRKARINAAGAYPACVCNDQKEKKLWVCRQRKNQRSVYSSLVLFSLRCFSRLHPFRVLLCL